MNNLFFKSCFLFFILSFLVPFNGFSHSSLQNKSPEIPLPNGYSKYIVFLGDGVYKSIDGSIMTGGIANANEAGIKFQRNIMKRSNQEIEIHKNKALDFFYERFGIDAENDPRILFTAYEVNPRNKIRAYTISDEKVPRKGWLVHDGGFMALVVHPDGVTLGNAFEGIHANPNTALVFGEYKVMKQYFKVVNNKKVKVKDPFVIRYRSKDPLAFSQFGSGIRCELDNDDFGPGFNGGMFGPVQLNNGYLQPNIKAVLTFPPLGPNTQCNHERF